MILALTALALGLIAFLRALGLIVLLLALMILAAVLGFTALLLALALGAIDLALTALPLLTLALGAAFFAVRVADFFLTLALVTLITFIYLLPCPQCLLFYKIRFVK